MTPDEVPAELVEKAARAIHASQCCPLDKDSQCYGWPINLEEESARHALAAVLLEVRAQAQQDLITDLLAQDLWSVRYELNEYPIRAVPQSALFERRNRIARSTATTEGPTT